MNTRHVKYKVVVVYIENVAEINTEIRNSYLRIKSKKSDEIVNLNDEDGTIATVFAKYHTVLGMQDVQIDSIQQLKDMIQKNIEKTGAMEESYFDSVYCYCGRSSPNMICCENSNCLIKWYHWDCAGIQEEEARPDKKWYCHRCLYNDINTTYSKSIEIAKETMLETPTVLVEDASTTSVIPLKRQLIESDNDDDLVSK